MMQATVDPTAFLLSEVQRDGGHVILVAPCPDYESFAKLPKVLQFEGQRFTLTGWNSDRFQAYWKPYLGLLAEAMF